MYRAYVLALVWACVLSIPAQGTDWYLDSPALIHANGRWPSLCDGTIAFLDGEGGPVMYFQNGSVQPLYPASLHNYEPANAGSTVAWRNVQATASTNEILRWDGADVDNVSNSPNVADTDVSAASNGDLIWSQNHYWLMHYDAATGETENLQVRAIHPAAYVTAAGVLTYAYQDPLSYGMRYFDGTTTYDLGPGATYGPETALHDGGVAWVAAEVGDLFNGAEIYFWKNGTKTRITNDDAVNGKMDRFPSVWNGKVIWTRFATDPFSPRLWIWDGTGKVQLTFQGGQTPSYRDGQVAYVDVDGLYLANVLSPGGDGDMNCDGILDFSDINPFVLALLNPTAYHDQYPGCTVLKGDLNADGELNFSDINPFVQALLNAT